MTVLKNSDIASLPDGSKIRETSSEGSVTEYERRGRYWVVLEESLDPLLLGLMKAARVDPGAITFLDADFAVVFPGETLELLFKPEEAVA